MLTRAFAAGDDELRDLGVTDWPCLNQLSGTAKTPDGIERNLQKNRSPIDLNSAKIEALDAAGFLKKVAAYDAQLKAQRRTELTASDKEKLRGFEDQLVSLTGYLVLAYSGPPETCNCGDKVHHDHHLEIFEQSADHHPQPGDPTPIICEITPRTEQLIYRSGTRLQEIAGFFRSHKQYIPTNHPSQLVRITGYVMWDDEHNGTADIGSTVQYITPGNGFHHPWRSTAWEIHPVVKVEHLNAGVAAPTASPPAGADRDYGSTSDFAILTQPVIIEIADGETRLEPGTRVRVVKRDRENVQFDYLGRIYRVPAASLH